MKTKTVNIFNGETTPPLKVEIPIIDGVRGHCSAMGYKNKETNEWVTCFSDDQTALEKDVDDLLRNFITELMPLVQFLSKLDPEKAAEKAISYALTQRNSGTPNRVEAAKKRSSFVPRYQEIYNVLPADFSMQLDSYIADDVWLEDTEGGCTCIHITSDGFQIGWGDGYHRNYDKCPIVPVNQIVETHKRLCDEWKSAETE